MIEKCPFCGNAHMTQRKTRYIYHRGDRFMIVNDVPCLRCDYCGEEYFEAAILNKIESDFRDIEATIKQPQQVIEIPVEDFAAI